MNTTNDAPSDHELVARVKQGDMTAFDQLMLRHQDAVGRLLRGFASGEDAVEDMTQTVFVKAYMGLARYRPDRPFFNWLRRIAYRTGCDHWNQERRRRTTPLHECEEWLADTRQPRVNDGFVSCFMEQLKPAERKALSLLYVDGLSMAEVAAKMGWNRDATKMRAYRARNKLRKLIAREIPGKS